VNRLFKFAIHDLRSALTVLIFGGLTSAGDLLRRNAELYAAETSLIFGEKRFTWSQTNRRANRFADFLQKSGINRGARVAIYAKNCHQWVEALFAIAKIGAISVTINYRLTAGEARYIVENSGAKAVLCDNSTLENALQIADFVVNFDKSEKGGAFFENLIENGSDEEPFLESEIEPNEAAMLLYTSGTTGFPKGAVYTHNSLLVGMFVHVLAIGSNRTHRVMLPSPLYSAAGIAGIYCAVYVASQISLINYTVKTACETIERERITFTNLVPTTIQMLLASEESRKYDLTSLEVLLYGGSPIPETVLREAMRRFPKCDFRQTFATTETGCAGTVLEPRDHRDALENENLRHRLQSCGRPQVNVDVRVVDDDWNFLPVGEIGEIAVRTEANMKEYWNNPEATAKVLKNGWLRTGDLARIDADGFVYLVDRKNDLIVSGALNVYPSEVERVLEQHPAVKEVAVIGVLSEKWGEAVRAVVVLRENAFVSEKDLIDFCDGKIAGFKKPKSVDFVEKLPRNLTGKVLKKELREKYRQEKT
jgi:acyl-CoA synthetase (AMP-forming)/AMP-acid ligase II